MKVLTSDYDISDYIRVNPEVPAIMYNHVNIVQAIKNVRINALVQSYNKTIDRFSNLCLKGRYTNIDDVIFHVNADKLKYYYYIEVYNFNIFLIPENVKEMNLYLTQIEVNENLKGTIEYNEIVKYCQTTGVPFSTFSFT